MEKEMIIVLDFGGQYNQLIARRVRECNVYCEVQPYTISIEELKEKIANYEKIATLPKTDNSVWLRDYTPKERAVIMFGTESCGLSKELIDFADKNITIEMSDKVESLNLSISAGVILYKLFN